MKTYLWILGLCAMITGYGTAGPLSNYPLTPIFLGSDLLPLSRSPFSPGTTLDITGQNFANQLAIVGNYPTLSGTQTWTGGNTWNGGQTWNAANQHTGNELFIGGVTLPIGPVNSILRISPISQVTYVTIGSNLNMDGNGVLSATFSVATNNISLPLAITNGGTGSANAPAALLGLGAARLDGTTPFPNVLDQGPATNQILVLEQLPNGQQFTSIGAAPGNGYSLGSTNTTPGVAWFPNPSSTRVTGNTTTTGWTNNTGVPCVVSTLINANSIWIISDASGPWTTNNFGGPSLQYIPVVAGGSIVVTAGSFFVGQYHSIMQ